MKEKPEAVDQGCRDRARVGYSSCAGDLVRLGVFTNHYHRVFRWRQGGAIDD